MATVKRVGVISLGKILGCVYALIGLIVGAFVSVLSLAGAFAASTGGDRVAAMLFGGAAVIVFPLMYGLLGFLGGLLMAALYNVCASAVGGLEIELDQPIRPSGFPVGQL